MTNKGLRQWLMALLSALALFSLAVSAPTLAHKEHKKKQPVAAQVVKPGAQPTTPAVMQGGPTAIHGQMGEMTEEKEDRSQMSFVARLLDWLGRLHPVIVHFPIAFFPAALLTAIIGRRRPSFATPVQSLSSLVESSPRSPRS